MFEALGVAAARGAAAEQSAFEALSDRALDDAYRLASVVLRDPVEAEDAVQDAVMAAHRQFRSLRDPARFDAWFGRIVLNQCRDRLRSRARERVRELAIGAESPTSAADATGDVIRRDAIAAAFPRLDADLQLVVALRFYRDLPLERIAELLGVPLGTVKSRLHTAMKRLRAELERQGWNEGADR